MSDEETSDEEITATVGQFTYRYVDGIWYLDYNDTLTGAAPSVWSKLDRIHELETETAHLKQVLARPDVHLVKIDDEGWVIQHPPSCPDLFGCWSNDFSKHGSTILIPLGVYELLSDFTIREWSE